MTTVEVILKQKGSDVVSVRTEVSLSEASGILRRRRIGAVVVLDDHGGVAGILSERDIVGAIADGGGDALAQSVGEVMTKDVVTCSPSDHVEKLMGVMTRTRVRHLPVLDEGKLCGIISIGDVVKERLEEAEQEVGALRDYIASG